MFGWNDSMSVGVSELDSQHRRLFEIINDLHLAMKSGQSKAVLGQTLDKLVDYTVKHFTAEEALMREKSYPALFQHKQIHDEFTARMKKFQDQHKAGAMMVTLDVMAVLQKWLVDHIQGTDLKYARELRLQG